MPTIRFSQMLAERDEKAAAHKYSRPERTATPATPNETEAARASLDYTQIDRWCDDYRVRLFLSTIEIPNAKNELSTRTSGVDRAVLGALCKLMRREEEVCFGASEAEVARLANVSENTAGASLIRLTNAAYIIRNTIGSGVAARYILVVNKLDKMPAGITTGHIEHLTDLFSLIDGDLSDPAYHAKNLGKNTLQVYAYLLVNPNSRPSQIADRETGLGVHASNVANHLKKLERLGMARVDEKRWSVVTSRVKTDADLKKITGQMGAERSERRAAREMEKDQERQAALDRLRGDLADLPANRPLFDSDEQYQEALTDLNEQIARLNGETAQHTRQQGQRAANRAEYERLVVSRFEGFLRARGMTEQEALNLVTGDRKAGRSKYPLVADYIRLRQKSRN